MIHYIKCWQTLKTICFSISILLLSISSNAQNHQLNKSKESQCIPCNGEPGSYFMNKSVLDGKETQGGFVSNSSKVSEDTYIGKDVQVCNGTVIVGNSAILGGKLILDGVRIHSMRYFSTNIDGDGFIKYDQKSENDFIRGEYDIISSDISGSFNIEGNFKFDNAVINVQNARIYGETTILGSLRSKFKNDDLKLRLFSWSIDKNVFVKFEIEGSKTCFASLDYIFKPKFMANYSLIIKDCNSTKTDIHYTNGKKFFRTASKAILERKDGWPNHTFVE